MFKKTKFAIAFAVAAATMAVTASSALALEATISPAGTITATSSSVSFEGGGNTITCPLTLTNSLLAGPIGVAEGNQLGETTGVTIGPCTGGSVERVLELNWRLILRAILTSGGAVEREKITGFLVRVHIFSIAINFLGIVNCLYRGDLGVLIGLKKIGTGRYTITGIRVLEEVTLTFVRGSEACPSTDSLRGSFTISPSQTITVS